MWMKIQRNMYLVIPLNFDLYFVSVRLASLVCVCARHCAPVIIVLCAMSSENVSCAATVTCHLCAVRYYCKRAVRKIQPARCASKWTLFSFKYFLLN